MCRLLGVERKSLICLGHEISDLYKVHQVSWMQNNGHKQRTVNRSGTSVNIKWIIFLVFLGTERHFEGTTMVYTGCSAVRNCSQMSLWHWPDNWELQLTDILFQITYNAAAIVQFQYNLMRTARWLRSGAAVNIKFPGTGFRRGPSQLQSIQECRAWTATWSWGQHFAHTTYQNRFTNSIEICNVCLSWNVWIEQKQLLLDPNWKHFCKQLSVNPITVRYSEIEGETERKKERENVGGATGEKRGACAQLQQGFMAWETIYKSQRLS